MKLLLTISFLCCTAASFAQRVPSSCDAPDSLKKFYREDAAWLAYQFEKETQSSFVDSVIIPQPLQDIFMRALLAVHNASVLPAVDTLTNFKFSRDFGPTPTSFSSVHPFSLDRIVLSADSTILWERNLVKGISPTGNSTFDSLMKVYGITFDSIYYYPNYWIALTHIPYNILVLDSLINIAASDHLLADFFGWVGGGDMTEGHLQKDSSITLIYSVGWGDCPSGCIERRFWHFTVFLDCSVRFDSSYGDPLSGNKVVAETETHYPLILHPNPAMDKLIITTLPRNVIHLLDLQGKEIATTLCKTEKLELDVSPLPKGIYIINVVDKTGNHQSAKFIKE